MLTPRTVFALVVVQVLFGLHPIFSKLAFPYFGPGGVSAARVIGAAVVFQAVRLARREPGLPWATHARIAVAALFGISANQLLFLYGLSHTSATHAVLLIVCVPVVTLVAALLTGRERASAARVLGIAVAFAGAALVITGRGTMAEGELVGDLMILGNAVAYAIYLLQVRDLLGVVPPWSLAAALFTWGVPQVLVVTGIPAIPDAPPAAWGALAFVVLGSTVATYLLNLFALRSVPASVVAVFVCIQPTIAAALAWPLLGERLDGRTLLAGGVTIVGMVVATRRVPERTAAAAG